MRKRESFLIIRRAGRDCQADRREDGIIRRREREGTAALTGEIGGKA
jgi:hypothetical protein